MKVAVLGATSFIGRTLLPELAEEHGVVTFREWRVDDAGGVLTDVSGRFDRDADVGVVQSERVVDADLGLARDHLVASARTSCVSRSSRSTTDPSQDSD